MKKFTKVLLALTLIAAMVVPSAMGVFAAEKEATGTIGDGHGCGFIDSNLTVTSPWVADSIADLEVTVNGKPAYWNLGYLGQKHCGLGGDKLWTQIGIVGADLVTGDKANTVVIADNSGSTYTQTFTSNVNALGTSYAKVFADAAAKTVVAEIVFNTDPGLAVGTTFEGKCHDDHGNKGTFTVTAYDKDTKVYTISAENYVPKQSLLELKVTSEGTYKDYFVSATINAMDSKATFIGDSAIVDASTKVALSNPTVTVDTNGNTFSVPSRLFDAQNNGVGGQKIEGNWPGAMTITFEAAEGAKPSYIVFYTDDDGNYSNRAPKTVTISASKDNATWTVLKDNVAAGIENYNESAFALELMATEEYKYFKVQITEKLGDQGGYFQLEEIMLLEGDKVEGTSREKIEDLVGPVAYNGTAPVCPHTETELKNAKDATETEKGYTGDKVCKACGETVEKGKDIPATGNQGGEVKPAPTGDTVVALVVLSVVSLLGAAVISKKRG